MNLKLNPELHSKLTRVLLDRSFELTQFEIQCVVSYSKLISGDVRLQLREVIELAIELEKIHERYIQKWEMFEMDYADNKFPLVEFCQCKFGTFSILKVGVEQYYVQEPIRYPIRGEIALLQTDTYTAIRDDDNEFYDRWKIVGAADGYRR